MKKKTPKQNKKMKESPNLLIEKKSFMSGLIEVPHVETDTISTDYSL